MIKINELRIGNILVYPSYNSDESDKNWKVRDLYYEGDKIGLTDGRYQTIVSFDLMKPIPLTEEWLLNFGFDGDSYANFFLPLSEYSNLVISFKDYACSQIREDVTIADHDIESPCKYVHQLQNLYYALTGKELTISPTASTKTPDR